MTARLRLRIGDYARSVELSARQLGRLVDGGEFVGAHASALAQVCAGLADAALELKLPDESERPLVQAQLTQAIALLESAVRRLDEAADRAAWRSAVQATVARLPGGFAEAFDAAFDRIRGPRGLNLVALADLRAALPAWDRVLFDRELYELRRANRYVLHSHDGRHGRVTDAQHAARIEEDGRTFIYVARRES